MKIKLHQVSDEGLHLEGEEPSAILDISEPLFCFKHPIRYQLDAFWVGHRNLLVKGRLSTIVRAQCVRTLEWFDLPIVVEDFQCHRANVRGDEADLTPEIREDILLLLPANPVSPRAKPLKAGPSAGTEKGSQVWGRLDQLKLK
ncbi:MAG: hypothetical protein HY360_13535 [Verrucomicrobia bacterium]|nr:hypothetical protein [Verrucomicrobiota bacterium]